MDYSAGGPGRGDAKRIRVRRLLLRRRFEEEDVAAAAGRWTRELGGITSDLNAGISVRNTGRLHSQWNRTMTSTWEACSCARGRRAAHEEQGERRHLMTASTNGTEGHRWYADYNASKARRHPPDKTMALELAPVVRVTARLPRLRPRAPMQRAGTRDRDAGEGQRGHPHEKRHAEPEEIASSTPSWRPTTPVSRARTSVSTAGETARGCTDAATP